MSSQHTTKKKIIRKRGNAYNNITREKRAPNKAQGKVLQAKKSSKG